MITPIDIQNTSFKSGLGYDKKEVDAFKEEMLTNFEELYRTNVELKDKINLLTEGLQHYKSIEVSLQKAVVLAERTSEEKIKTAENKAKNIEKEAVIRSQEMTKDAKAEYTQTVVQTQELIQQYAQFKVAFARLLSQEMLYLLSNNLEKKAYDQSKTGSFAEDSKENPFSEMKKYMELAKHFTGGAAPSSASASQSDSSQKDFEFDGDPQSRDVSTLTGMDDGGSSSLQNGYSNHKDIATAGFGYSSLTDNDEFKDPFANK